MNFCKIASSVNYDKFEYHDSIHFLLCTEINQQEFYKNCFAQKRFFKFENKILKLIV